MNYDFNNTSSLLIICDISKNDSKKNIKFICDSEIDLIGKGGFGKVWKVSLKKTGELYALKEMYKKIDQSEATMIKGEFSTGVFVNAASVIMRLGVATTILVGAQLILSGEIPFMLLFMFLLAITRVYAPFDQSLALIAEVFLSEVSASRINEIYDTPIAKGKKEFTPEGHDISFYQVSFSYDEAEVLHDVSFVAKQGEVTALVGPPVVARALVRVWLPVYGTWIKV